MNKVVLMGRMTKDAELKQTASNVSYANFSVAVQRRFKNQNGEYDTDFINCTAWHKTAEFISKYFHKGDMIGICGSIQTRKWTTDSGENRYATEVVADEAHFCQSKGAQNQQTQAPQGSGQIDTNALPNGADFAKNVSEDDLPF